MESVNANKVQTAFRLDRNLVSRIKFCAAREDKSLNTFVEEILTASVRPEVVFPHLEIPENDEFVEEIPRYVSSRISACDRDYETLKDEYFAEKYGL